MNYQITLTILSSQFQIIGYLAIFFNSNNFNRKKNLLILKWIWLYANSIQFNLILNSIETLK